MANSVAKLEGTSSGWQAQLDLEFSASGDKTILFKRKQFGPLTVQRAFYPEGDVCHLYILHPPGGVVGGDSLTINTQVNDTASTLLTTPGATKFYRSQGSTARQEQNLTISGQSSLEWLPQENIYFPGAQVHMNTRINLDPQARFIGWETHCFGLPVNNELFLTGHLQLDVSIMRDDKPLLIERLKVDADRLNMPAGLRGNSIMGMLVATPANDDLLETVRAIISESKALIAATLVEECLLLRYLGNSTLECRKLFTQVWVAIRPLILERTACLPRIWAT
jgi:urease accessory protein